MPCLSTEEQAAVGEDEDVAGELVGVLHLFTGAEQRAVLLRDLADLDLRSVPRESTHDPHDDLSPGVPLIHVGDGLGRLAQWVGPVDAWSYSPGLDEPSQSVQVFTVLLGDEGRQLWPTNRESTSARIWRSVPPSQRPPVSPPTITRVPFGVSARLRRDSEELPPMSRITS